MSTRMVQRGLSLVELMVALVIGSFLILGATQLYLNSKRGQLFSSSSAENVENARFGVLVLEEQLSKAGFRRAPDQEISTAFPAGSGPSVCRSFPAGAAVVPLSNSDKGFCFRYQAAVDDEVSCSNENVGVDRPPFSPSVSDELVYVAIQFEAGDEQQQGRLTCTTKKGSVTGDPEPIIDGVADFRVFMAEGHPRVKKLSQDAFKLPSALAQDAVVRAVNYEVLLASGPNRREGESSIFEDYVSRLDSSSAQALRNKDKRHVYQLATGGQALRNLMP